MTPDLMEDGALRRERLLGTVANGQTESGGRAAGYGRVHTPGQVDTTHGRILYLEDVHVSFDGFKAINGLSLDIAPGELRCIIGPNGAGKTTMMDIITGKTPSICFATASPRSPRWASAASFRNPRCSSNSPYLKTWSWRWRPTNGFVTAWCLR
jgi:hypothetical protein